MTEKTNKDANKKIDKQINKILEAIPAYYLEFIQHYMAGSTRQGALEACGKASGNPTDDKELINEMMRAPAVRNYISLMKKKIANKTLDMVDRKLSDIATAEVLDMIEIGTKSVPVVSQGELVTSIEEPDIKLIDESEMTAAQRASIKSIKVVKGEIHVEFHDPVKAMDMLIKRNAGYKDNLNVNHGGNINVFACIGDNGRGPKGD